MRRRISQWSFAESKVFGRGNKCSDNDAMPFCSIILSVQDGFFDNVWFGRETLRRCGVRRRLKKLNMAIVQDRIATRNNDIESDAFGQRTRYKSILGQATRSKLCSGAELL
jgi:hypothetical protein